MTKFYDEKDTAPAAIAGQTVASVGCGNQGRPWALNVRDSGQFDDEWDAEAAEGYPTLAALKERHAGAGVRSTRFAMHQASVGMTC